VGGLKKRILVVDDEPTFCKLLMEYFIRLGYEASISMDGKEALEILRKGETDVLTLDMRMPGLNGYDILEKLSAEKSPVKVVVISAIDTLEMEERLVIAGAHAVLRKPVGLLELGAEIKKLTD
jgi:CheY-like chemotaxis protein